MRLTERDLGMMSWINGHGFVTIEQAARWMGTTYSAGQRRLKILTDNGYLKRNTFEHLGAACFWLTKKGAEICGDDLPPPRVINRVTFKHDRMLVDLSEHLQTQHGGSFLTERRLRNHVRSKRGGYDEPHLPDGLLYLDDQKPIAIELELSIKSASRLQGIIDDYVTNTKLGGVWYFVTTTTVGNAVRRKIDGLDGFRVTMWETPA